MIYLVSPAEGHATIAETDRIKAVENLCCACPSHKIQEHITERGTQTVSITQI